MNSFKEAIKNLSTREKVLIYILIIVIIIMAGWMLLASPAMTKHNELVAQKDQIQTSLKKYNVVVTDQGEKVDVAKITETITNLKAGFYGVMETEDIDQLFTEQAQKYRLTPISLTIDEATETTLNQYMQQSVETPSTQDSTSTQTNTTDATTSQNTDTNKEESNGPTVYISEVQQTLTGAYKNVDLLVNDIRGNNGIQITSIAYGPTNEATQTFTISYKLYMIKK